MVSVFTATYNRAYVLGNLYKSLCKQTCFDFEWIIVDDGSKDGTEELVDLWLDSKNAFPIIYRKRQNGGKHRAINYGVSLAQSEAFFIVDSDDVLVQDAIEFINREFDRVVNDNEYAGISGMRISKNGEIIGGNPGFSDYIDATNLERSRYCLTGDKAEVYKTSVLKQYPFPEFANETFLTEGVVWDAIAYDGFKIRWYNKPLYYTEYMADGLTRNNYDKRKKNPFGWAEWIRRERAFGRLKGHELSEALFAFIETVDLSQNTVCKILEITEKDYKILYNKKKSIIERIRREMQSHMVKRMALYGYGYDARRLLEYIKGMEIEVPYVIDRRFSEISEVPAYPVQAALPDVDSVCITLRKPEPEIKDTLERKLSKSYIWQLADFF